MKTEARLKIKGKRFEILVDLDKALKIKKGETANLIDALETDTIFSDIKKGLRAGESDLKESFGTADRSVIIEKIIKSGEVLLPADYKSNERENILKQVVDFLSKNALDPVTNRPHTPVRIEQALKQSGINITNKPIEEQMKGILDAMQKVIPLKIEKKRLSIIVPSEYTGHVYGILKEYKEKEDWKNDGSLQVVVSMPVGMQLSFFDKLNGITHGSAIVEELK